MSDLKDKLESALGSALDITYELQESESGSVDYDNIQCHIENAMHALSEGDESTDDNVFE